MVKNQADLNLCTTESDFIYLNSDVLYCSLTTFMLCYKKLFCMRILYLFIMNGPQEAETKLYRDLLIESDVLWQSFAGRY